LHAPDRRFAPGRHQIDLTGADGLNITFAVAVDDLAIDQVGQRGEADVRMGPRIEALSGTKGDRAEAVEEDKRTYHPPLRGGQRTSHLKTVA
jgi:hypothetical protein